MDETHYKLLYKNLIDDMDFERLELELKEPNIFQVLSVSRAEIRHSNFLGWLLDPNGNHGMGGIFLKKFLREIASSDIETNIDQIEIENMNFQKTEIRREWKHIDLLIIIEDTVVCIENKVDTVDHSNQLQRYRKIVEEAFPNHKKAYVYLSPSGLAPTSKTEAEYYALHSYEHIAQQIETVLEVHGHSMIPKVKQYISDYLITLKREIMKNDSLNEIANKIYRNHKELIDFVYDNKTDISTEMYEIFEQKIEATGWVMGSKNKGYARFTTPELEKIIPKNSKSWPDKEHFLFEFDFLWVSKSITFKPVIAPGSESIRNILSEAMETIPGHATPKGTKWLVHFTEKWSVDRSELEVREYDRLKESIDREWDKVTALVEKVEAAFLEKAAELKDLQ